MNLSKELKKKRDAEARLNRQSPQPTFTSDGTTDAYIDTTGLATKAELTGYMKLLSGSALPTASEDYRGKIFTVLGDTGVADVAYICLKDVSDVYNWVII